jgi:hypothetical protein
MSKIKKIKPYTKHWESMANQIARDFAPEIYPCKHCGNPTLTGYCCTRCGSSTPR